MPDIAIRLLGREILGSNINTHTYGEYEHMCNTITRTDIINVMNTITTPTLVSIYILTM